MMQTGHNPSSSPITPNVSSRIRYLSVFFTMCIICYHCGSDSSPSRLNSLANDMFAGLGTLAMSYFFTVTGLLLHNSLNPKTYCRKIKSRVTTLLLPYLWWQILFTALFVFRGMSYSPSNWISTVFLFDAWPPDGALWYVYAVFCLSLLSFLGFPLAKYRHQVFYIILLLFPALHYMTNQISAGNTSYLGYGYLGNIISYLPSYLIGSFFGSIGRDESTNYLRKLALPALLIIPLAVERPELIAWCELRLLPILLLYAGPTSGRITTVTIQPIQNLTFIMYAIHQPFLIICGSQLRSLVEKDFLHPLISNVLYRVVVLACVILISRLIRMIVSKASPTLLKLFTGGDDLVSSHPQIDVK